MAFAFSSLLSSQNTHSVLSFRAFSCDFIMSIEMHILFEKFFTQNIFSTLWKAWALSKLENKQILLKTFQPFAEEFPKYYRMTEYPLPRRVYFCVRNMIQIQFQRLTPKRQWIVFFSMSLSQVETNLEFDFDYACSVWNWHTIWCE